MSTSLRRARRAVLACAAMLTVIIGAIALVIGRDEPWATSGLSVVIALITLPLLTIAAIAFDRRAARASRTNP